MIKYCHCMSVCVLHCPAARTDVDTLKPEWEEWEELKRKHEAAFIRKWVELKRRLGFTPRAMEELSAWAHKRLGADADKRLWRIFTADLALYTSYLHTLTEYIR